MNAMSRLAREELRHFEQVVALIESRGGRYVAVSPSRYAAGLHALARKDEPGKLVDTLIIGAIIEARSCERFASLVGPLEAVDAELSRLYASLLRSESRHFEDYLGLARASVAGPGPVGADDDLSARIGVLLARDEELIGSVDTELRFHSGVVAVAEAGAAAD
jgi:tRNA-(ms[2]io[6]A)-hydroxylase